jgi:hypothetical protein
LQKISEKKGGRVNYKLGIKGVLVVLGFVLFSLIYIAILSGFEDVTSTTIPEEQQQGISNKSFNIPDSVYVFGERVPTDIYYVREALQREIWINSYWHSHSYLVLSRSYRYFPHIEKVLKENGIPDDFKYIAVIESDLGNAVSPKGASGMWQFMKQTAKEYKLEVNSQVDERFNLEKSTLAFCRYINKMNSEFNSWTLSAAAYNAGRSRIKRQLNKQQCDNYFDLHLNEETARYVYRIVAMKIIFENPEYYGFKLEDNQKNKPIEYKEILVKEKVKSWSDFARTHNISYKALKDFNPWIKDSYLRNRSNKEYKVKIPEYKRVEKSEADSLITHN